VWHKEKTPEEWQLAIMCTIYIKGDIMNRHNYRGISLLNTMYKILSGLILNRIKPYSKDIIEDYQCSFTSGKSTIDHIFTVKQLVEKHYEFNKDLFMLFI